MALVYSYYVMDIYHDGHREMLENCRAVAGPEGLLVVGILTDHAVMERKRRPIQDFRQRVETARSLKMVDLVVAQTSYSPLPNCRALKPDVLMESTSHKEEDIAEARRVLSEWGGRVMVIPYWPAESSTRIKHRIAGTDAGEAEEES